MSLFQPTSLQGAPAPAYAVLLRLLLTRSDWCVPQAAQRPQPLFLQSRPLLSACPCGAAGLPNPPGRVPRYIQDRACKLLLKILDARPDKGRPLQLHAAAGTVSHLAPSPAGPTITGLLVRAQPRRTRCESAAGRPLGRLL